MEKKRLIYIDVLTTTSLVFGMLGVGRQFFEPNLYTFFSAIGLLCCSQFLLKRDSKAIRLVLAFSIASGGVGLIIFMFYLIALFSGSHFTDDCWAGITGGLLMLWGIATAFYITRPKIKEQFMILEAVKSEEEFIDKNKLSFGAYISCIKKRIGLLPSLYNFIALPFFAIIWLLFYIFCVPILFIIWSVRRLKDRNGMSKHKGAV